MSQTKREILDKKLSEMTKQEIDILFEESARELNRVKNPFVVESDDFALKVTQLEEALGNDLKGTNARYFKAHCYLAGTNTSTYHVKANKQTALDYFAKDKSPEADKQIDKIKYEGVVNDLRQNWEDYSKTTKATLDKIEAPHQNMDPYKATRNMGPAIESIKTGVKYHRSLEATEKLLASLQPDKNSPNPYESCLRNYKKLHDGAEGQTIIKCDQKAGLEHHAIASWIVSKVSFFSKSMGESLGKYLETNFFKSKSISTAQEKLETIPMKDRLKSIKQETEEPDKDLDKGGPTRPMN